MDSPRTIVSAPAATGAGGGLETGLPSDRRILRHAPAGAAVVLAALVALAPLPFASVGPGSVAALQAAAGLALALAAPVALRRSLRPVAAPALALAGLGLWGAIQALPLPAGLVALLSPERARWGERAAEALAAGAPDGTAAAVPSTLSLAPGDSLRTGLLFAALAAAFTAAALAGRERRHRRWIAGALAAVAAFEALYGARRLMAGLSVIWGVDVPGASDRLRGTFINPNHFAGFLEIALAVTFAWLWVAIRHGRFEEAIDRRLALAAPPALLWVGLFVALGFTRSRAGLAAAVVGVAAQGLAIAAATRRWRLAPAGLAAAAVGLGVVATVGLQQTLGRFAEFAEAGPGEVAWEMRLTLYRLTLDLWTGNPLFGTGLGTFADALPLVQPQGMGLTILHAHSDPLELLLTGGAVAAAIALFGVWRLAVRLGRVLTVSVRSEDRGAALAALGALAAVAVHESFDFVLTTPANAFALAVVCGAAAGVPVRRVRRRPAAALDPAAAAEEGL